jgi:hypothetical protein
MLPSTESGLPLDGRKPKYSQSLAVQMTIITVDQKFVRALPLSHSSAPEPAYSSSVGLGGVRKAGREVNSLTLLHYQFDNPADAV